MERHIGTTIKWKERKFRVCKSGDPYSCRGCVLESIPLRGCLQMWEDTGFDCSSVVREDGWNVHLIELKDNSNKNNHE